MVLNKAQTYIPKKAITPFLVTLRVAEKHLHNYMMESGASTNIISYEVCKALNLPIVEIPNGITQLDSTPMKVVGMIHNLHIQIAFKS